MALLHAKCNLELFALAVHEGSWGGWGGRLSYPGLRMES